MAKNNQNHIKLGVFVMAGLAFLILLLYVIGRNQNLFGKTFSIKARFSNVHGLTTGNNIRFAGIDAGTVKEIDIINDTTIEVTLLVKRKMQAHIHKNATVSITTDGLMGNKLVNILPAKTAAPLIEEGDVLYSTPGPDTDEMLAVLSNTNNDVAIVARELKLTVKRLNESEALWMLLNDKSLPANLRLSLANLKTASAQMNVAMSQVQGLTSDIREGKGSVGQLIKDTAVVVEIREAVAKIKGIGVSADSLSAQISTLVNDINREVKNGEGTVATLLTDKKMADRLQGSINNIEAGTRSFNENMEALKHNFLFRGYFKKLEKKQKNEAAAEGEK